MRVCLLYIYVCVCVHGYPGMVLRSTRSAQVTSLRPLQNRKTNSQYRVWCLNPLIMPIPSRLQKKSWESNPYLGSVPVLTLVLFGLYRPPNRCWAHRIMSAPLGQKHKEPSSAWDRTHDHLYHRGKAWHLGYGWVVHK